MIVFIFEIEWLVGECEACLTECKHALSLFAVLECHLCDAANGALIFFRNEKARPKGTENDEMSEHQRSRLRLEAFDHFSKFIKEVLCIVWSWSCLWVILY